MTALAVLAALTLLAAPLALAQTDTTGPSFSKARVDGSRLVVFFDEALDSASAPVGSAFSVVATLAGCTCETGQKLTVYTPKYTYYIHSIFSFLCRRGRKGFARTVFADAQGGGAVR